MKRYILTLISLFFIITHVSGNAYGQEQITVYPNYIKCGDTAKIGVALLNAQQTYKLIIDCGNLECANNFEALTYEIKDKTHYTIEQKFNVYPGCLEVQPTQETLNDTNNEISSNKIDPPGKYLATLYNNEKVVASRSFNLIPSSSKICELKTNPIAKINQAHPFKLVTNQTCVFNISIIDPSGVRIPVTSQFIETTREKEFSIKEQLLLKEGSYKLTAVATPQCDAELDRECKSATFEVIGSNITDISTEKGCVYIGNDSEANCFQCSSGSICNTNNLCDPDTKGVCKTTSKQIDNVTEPTSARTDVVLDFIKNKPNHIVLGLVTFGIFIASILIFVLLFKRFRYRIEGNDTK